MKTHEDFLREALALAQQGMEDKVGGPFGALVVRDGEVIARASNAVRSTNDPTAHAEVQAIRKACEKLGTYQLDDCVLYSSCEPCPMCLGAIYWARPKAVFYAATHREAAKAGFDDAFIYEELDKEPEKRRIPFQQIPLQEREAPFQFWENWEEKENY
jgi:guanine deaminase